MVYSGQYTMRIVLWQRCLFTLLTIAGKYQTKTSSPIHTCAHDQTMTIEIHRAFLNYAAPLRERRAATSLYKPLRITPYYYNLEEDNLNDNNIKDVKHVIQTAVNIIQQVLSVIPVSGPLLLRRTYCKGVLSAGDNIGKCLLADNGYEYEMCEDVIIPDDHLDGAWLWNSTHPQPVHVIKSSGTGLPNTDIVIYIKAYHTVTCNSQSVLAYSQYCQVDQNSRPIAGFINLCPHHLNDKLDLDKLITVAVHEMFHVLGFTRNLYEEFRDCSDSTTGLNCTKRQNTVIIDDNGQPRLTTPTVMAKVKEHFSCLMDDFGAPLENRAFESQSHWEMRMIPGSIMAPVITQAHETFLDPVTLGLFEDSGWYKVNFEHAQSMLWGKDEGCDFGLTSTCSESSFFCSNLSISGCHFLHNNKGTCSTNEFLDTCSVFTIDVNGWCVVANNSFLTEDSQQTGESFGQNSKCFVTNIGIEGSGSDGEPSGRCYQTRCNLYSYQILISGANWQDCHPDQTTSIPGYTGYVHCPSFEVICQNRSSLLSLINAAAADSDTSTQQQTSTPHQGSSFNIPYDDNLHVEIAFIDANESAVLDVDQNQQFQDALTSHVISVTNVTQDRLDLCMVDSTRGHVLVSFNLLQSNMKCAIPSSDAYKSLEITVRSHQFIIVHSDHNITATTIRIIDDVVSITTSPSPTQLSSALVAITSIVGAIILVVLLCYCKRKKCSSRIAPLDGWEVGQTAVISYSKSI